MKIDKKFRLKIVIFTARKILVSFDQYLGVLYSNMVEYAF